MHRPPPDLREARLKICKLLRANVERAESTSNKLLSTVGTAEAVREFPGIKTELADITFQKPLSADEAVTAIRGLVGPKQETLRIEKILIGDQSSEYSPVPSLIGTKGASDVLFEAMAQRSDANPFLMERTPKAVRGHFRSYVHGQAARLVAAGISSKDLKDNPSLCNAACDVVTTSFLLLKEGAIPRKLTLSLSRNYTIFGLFALSEGIHHYSKPGAERKALLSEFTSGPFRTIEQVVAARNDPELIGRLYYERTAEAFQRLRSGTRVVLSSHRPSASEIGSIAKILHSRMLDEADLKDITGDPLLKTFVRGLSRQLALQGARGSVIEDQGFQEELQQTLHYIAGEFRALQRIELPNDLLGRHGHTFSAGAIRSLYAEASKKLPSRVKQKPRDRWGARLVLTGMHSSIDELVEKIDDAESQEEAITSEYPEVRNFFRTLVSFYIEKRFPSVREGARRMSECIREAEEAFSVLSDPRFRESHQLPPLDDSRSNKGPVRVAALKRLISPEQSMEEIFNTYLAGLKEKTVTLGQDPQLRSRAATSAGIMFLGRSQNADRYEARAVNLRERAIAAFGSSSALRPLMYAAPTLVRADRFESIEHIGEALKVLRLEAEERHLYTEPFLFLHVPRLICEALTTQRTLIETADDFLAYAHRGSLALSYQRSKRFSTGELKPLNEYADEIARVRALLIPECKEPRFLTARLARTVGQAVRDYSARSGRFNGLLAKRSFLRFCVKKARIISSRSELFDPSDSSSLNALLEACALEWLEIRQLGFRSDVVSRYGHLYSSKELTDLIDEGVRLSTPHEPDEQVTFVDSLRRARSLVEIVLEGPYATLEEADLVTRTTDDKELHQIRAAAEERATERAMKAYLAGHRCDGKSISGEAHSSGMKDRIDEILSAGSRILDGHHDIVSSDHFKKFRLGAAGQLSGMGAQASHINSSMEQTSTILHYIVEEYQKLLDFGFAPYEIRRLYVYSSTEIEKLLQVAVDQLDDEREAMTAVRGIVEGRWEAVEDYSNSRIESRSFAEMIGNLYPEVASLKGSIAAALQGGREEPGDFSKHSRIRNLVAEGRTWFGTDQEISPLIPRFIAIALRHPEQYPTLSDLVSEYRERIDRVLLVSRSRTDAPMSRDEAARIALPILQDPSWEFILRKVERWCDRAKGRTRIEEPKDSLPQLHIGANEQNLATLTPHIEKIVQKIGRPMTETVDTGDLKQSGILISWEELRRGEIDPQSILRKVTYELRELVAQSTRESFTHTQFKDWK